MTLRLSTSSSHSCFEVYCFNLLHVIISFYDSNSGTGSFETSQYTFLFVHSLDMYILSWQLEVADRALHCRRPWWTYGVHIFSRTWRPQLSLFRLSKFLPLGHRLWLFKMPLQSFSGVLMKISRPWICKWDDSQIWRILTSRQFWFWENSEAWPQVGCPSFTFHSFFRGSQSGHVVFDQAIYYDDNVPQSYLTHGHGPVRASRASFLSRTLFD